MNIRGECGMYAFHGLGRRLGRATFVPCLLVAPVVASPQTVDSTQEGDAFDRARLRGTITARWDYGLPAMSSGGDSLVGGSRSQMALGGWGIVSIARNVDLTIRFLAISDGIDRAAASRVSLAGSVVSGPGHLLVRPRVGWAQASIGRFCPSLSLLSGEGAPILGAGIELHPGKLSLTLAAGESNAYSIASPWLPKRTLLMASFGVGSDTGGEARVTVVRARDHGEMDTAMDRRLGEGLLLSLAYTQRISDAVTIDAEAAGSGYTRDLRASALDESDQVASEIFRLYTSSRFDYAATVGAHLRWEMWEVALRANYAGPGYVPLASAFSDPDRLELTIAPRLSLLDGAVRLNGSLGHRSENMSRVMGNPSSRFTAALNLTATLSEALWMEATWNDFSRDYNRGFDADPAVTVWRSITVAPSMTFDADDIIHTLSARIAVDGYVDRLVGDIDAARASTVAFGLDYSGSFRSRPLTAQCGLHRARTADPLGGWTQISARAGLSYRFPAAGLSCALGGEWTTRADSDAAMDASAIARGALTWTPLRSLTFSFSGSVTAYRGARLYSASSRNPVVMRSTLTTSF